MSKNHLNQPNNSSMFYKTHKLPPTALELEKLAVAYLVWRDYLEGTTHSLPHLKHLWGVVFRRINSVLNQIGWNNIAEDMLREIKTVCFTVSPERGFAYSPKHDRFELNLWEFLFGQSDSGFLYDEGLRFRPVFEQAAVLLHEFVHHSQEKVNNMIGCKSDDELSAYIGKTYPKNEIEALLVERRMLEDYAKIKSQGVYKVQCCQISKWRDTGSCIADFSTTWELCEPIISHLKEAIDEHIEELKPLGCNEFEIEKHFEKEETNHLKSSRSFKLNSNCQSQHPISKNDLLKFRFLR
ncbi:MAG: hypothetical protein ABSF65_06770 [Candidatus Bathyarchaeia archaeon]